MVKILPVSVIVVLTLIIGVVFAKNIFASWVIDKDPPTFGPGVPGSCIQSTTWSTHNFSFNIHDNAADGFGIVQIKAFLMPDNYINESDALSPPANTTPAGFPSNYTWDLTGSVLGTPPSAGKYDIALKALDRAGNWSPLTLQVNDFNYITSGGCSWIQTISGDVHSNTGINAPGGP